MCSGVDWLTVSHGDVQAYKKVAVVADPEATSNPLWVIHATYFGDLLPGKLDVNTWEATVPYDRKAHIVYDYKVAVAVPKTITWVADVNGHVPKNAILGGKMKCSGEKLYIGRAKYQGELIPGKIHPSQKACYITYKDVEIAMAEYDVLCLRGGCIFKSMTAEEVLSSAVEAE